MKKTFFCKKNHFSQIYFTIKNLSVYSYNYWNLFEQHIFQNMYTICTKQQQSGFFQNELAENATTCCIKSYTYHPYNYIHRAQNQLELGTQGYNEFFCSSLKFLQEAQKCTGFCTKHLLVGFEDAIGLHRKR